VLHIVKIAKPLEIEFALFLLRRMTFHTELRQQRPNGAIVLVLQRIERRWFVTESDRRAVEHGQRDAKKGSQDPQHNQRFHLEGILFFLKFKKSQLHTCLPEGNPLAGDATHDSTVNGTGSHTLGSPYPAGSPESTVFTKPCLAGCSGS